MGVWEILLLIDCGLLILLVLLQGGKSSGASGAIMGGNTRVFTNTKERGAEKILSRLSMGVGIAFFILTIACGIF